MNERIRRTGIGLLVLFGVLLAQLTYLQVVAADRLSSHAGNIRAVLRDYAAPRGAIITTEERVVARSEPVNTEFRFRREYPTGPLFAHTAGFFSFTFGASGVEQQYNRDLAGRTEDLQFRNLGDVLLGKEQTGTVVLTLRNDVQEAAMEALGDRTGAVVALDPATGAVLALASTPSFDPSPLADHDQGVVREAWNTFTSDPDQPMLARAWRERYPPGSTFKVVTAAVALDAGVSEPDRAYPELRELDLPLTDRVIRNFGGSTCGGTLAESFRRSCNTTFAQVGLDLGEELVSGVRAFGLGEEIPFDLVPGPVRSEAPEAGTFEREQPRFAQAAIGQGPISVSPLQMALVVAGIANGGVIMEPRVMEEIRDIDGRVVERSVPKQWRRALSVETAEAVGRMMVSVVASGTGTRAQVPGVEVAGKTGTAQVGPGQDPHAWFVAYAPADDPRVAVAVIVEHGGELGSEATGGRVAAPVAKAVIEAALAGVPDTGR